ncbi:MAG: DUF1861 family protein [Patescibacteria group bacterium]
MSTSFEPEAEPTTPSTNGEIEREIEYLSFEDLEARYREKRDLETEQRKCRKLVFKRGGEEITDLIGYNTTVPILDKHYNDSDSGKPYFVLRVRMEKRDDEEKSKVVAFRAASAFSTEWEQIEGEEELPEIMGQDPSATELGEELFLSVVEVEPVPDDSESGSHLKWWQRFYKGPDIRHLVPVGRGPDGMKNITPVKMPTGEIITFTRPREPGNEALGGLGQIGEVTTNTIEDILDPSTNILQNAEFINTRFLPDEWGGIKYGKPMVDGRVKVVGHISRYDTESPLYKEDADEKPKKYATIIGAYNPLTRKLEDVEMVAMADEFPGVVPKDEYLKNVVFSGGMTDPDENGKVLLISGVGDAETWTKEIDDPFAGLRLADQDYQLAA